MTGLTAVLDSVFSLRGHKARFVSRKTGATQDILVLLEHGGRDEKGGEMLVKIRRSELRTEPESGSRIECDGQTYLIHGTFPAPQTSAFVWAVSCTTGRRTQWK